MSCFYTWLYPLVDSLHLCLQNSASTATKHMAAVESQPSPISVLDDAFYCEDSPSPVKKISTIFQGTACLL